MQLWFVAAKQQGRANKGYLKLTGGVVSEPDTRRLLDPSHGLQLVKVKPYTHDPKRAN